MKLPFSTEETEAEAVTETKTKFPCDVELQLQLVSCENNSRITFNANCFTWKFPKSDVFKPTNAFVSLFKEEKKTDEKWKQMVYAASGLWNTKYILRTENKKQINGSEQKDEAARDHTNYCVCNKIEERMTKMKTKKDRARTSIKCGNLWLGNGENPSFFRRSRERGARKVGIFFSFCFRESARHLLSYCVSG